MAIVGAKYWREHSSKYRLEASKCKNCDEIYFPPRLFCCGIETEKTSLPHTGKIFSFSTIHAGAPEGFQAPYTVAIIELDNGTKINAQIVDCKEDELKIGKRVVACFRKVQDTHKGIIEYSLKFKLA